MSSFAEWNYYYFNFRFNKFNNRFLKPLLIRDKEQNKRGQSIIDVYDKLSEKDAYDYIKRTSSMASFYSNKAFSSTSDMPSTLTQ